MRNLLGNRFNDILRDTSRLNDIFSALSPVLAITNNPNRRAEKYHIITQIRNARNTDVLKLVGENDIVQCITTGDLIARVLAAPDDERAGPPAPARQG